MQNIRIGVIGAGANTRSRHIPGFQTIEGVTVEAVCNRSMSSGQKAADEFGIPRVMDDWQQLIADPEIDAICIGTWPYMHHPMVLASLAAGKHVLTEARMAMDLAQAREMMAAAESTDVVSMIVPAPFYLEYEPTVLEMLSSGFFGDLLEIHARGMGGGYFPDAPVTWRQSRELSGNNIMSMGIINETVRRYAGHEKSVMAHGKVFTEERKDENGQMQTVQVPESLGIVAEHEGGTMTVYHFSTVAHMGQSGVLEFFGTKGSFKYENGQAWIAVAGEREFHPLEVASGKRGGWRVEEDFVDAIRDGAPVTHTSFADGVRYMEFTEAVQMSLHEGRRIYLPL